MSGTRVFQDDNGLPPASEFEFISKKSDFPVPVAGVITLEDNKTYFVTTVVDLTGDRLVGGQNTTIIGGSSENCRLKSTGLTGTALISSEWSMPIRFITIEANIGVYMDGDGNSDIAHDWNGLNFTDCGSVGTVKNCSNFIMLNGAFLNSGDMTFDGTIDTVGFDGCIFVPPASQNAIEVPATATITRRLRIIYSSVVAISAQSSGGINVANASSITNDETFILDTINFSGGGTYLVGVDEASNKSLFVNCVGITNTSVNGQMYMRGNASATSITDTVSFFKITGTTSASADNEKYTHSSNRLTNAANVERKYLIQCTLSFTTSSNNVCEFGFYDSKISTIRTPSITTATANSGGRAESVTMTCVVQHSSSDYIEVHCKNTTGANNITVTDMNVVITQFN